MLVALWFAFIENPKQTGILLGIYADFIGGNEGEMNSESYSKAVKGLSKYDYPLTWEPTATSNRISAQHSQFLYSGISHNKTGSLYLPKEDGGTLFLALTPKLKQECLKLLNEIYDIRELTLFPDIVGFCGTNSVNKDEWFNERW